MKCLGPLFRLRDKERLHVTRVCIYLLYCHLLPSPGSRHASCQEKSYSTRGAKLKKEKKNRKMSPLYPLSCRLGHKRTSTLQRLQIAVTTHNCSISSRSRAHLPGYAPYTPHHKPPPCSPSWTILLACLTSKPLFLKLSFTVSIHLFRGLPTEPKK